MRHYDRSRPAPAGDPVAPPPFSILDAQRIVAREHGFPSWPALRHYVNAASGRDPGDPGLARVLLDTLERNREAIELVRAGADRFDPRVVGIQSRCSDTFEHVLGRTGWPKVERVGHEAMEASVLIVGNCWTRGALSHRARPLLARRVRRGQAPAHGLAILTDQADCLAFRPVRYGLIGDFDEFGRLTMGNDVIDRSGLDRRRASMGIEPLETELRDYLAEAAEKGYELYPDRQAYDDDRRRIRRLGGWL